MNIAEPLIVTATGYRHLADAEADREALRHLYHAGGHPDDFDAVIVARDQRDLTRLVGEPSGPVRDASALRAGEGLAQAVAAAVLAGSPDQPLAGEPAAAASRAADRLDARDLEAIGDVVCEAQAGMIVVYTPAMADEVAGSLRSVEIAAVSRMLGTNAQLG